MSFFVGQGPEAVVERVHECAAYGLAGDAVDHDSVDRVVRCGSKGLLCRGLSRKKQEQCGEEGEHPCRGAPCRT